MTSNTPLSVVPPPAITASLEQLHRVSRELEGGLFAVGSASSSWLIDIEGRRFTRAGSLSDPQQLRAFGDWTAFADILCEGDDVVIVPTNGVRVRVRARTGAAI